VNGHFLLVETSAPYAAVDLLPRRRPYVLGRSSKCDIVVHHPSVSRRHAEISLVDSTVLVRDLRSCNGTFIDDERIERAPLTRGQRLRLGSVAFALTGTDVEEELQDSDMETDDADGYGRSAARPTVSGSAEPALTLAQLRVFQLLLAGLLEKTIAHRLALSLHTVHNHVRAIYKAFGVHSRAQLLASQLQKGGLHPVESESRKP
jgi:DNA-binding CsgD family transcriptional regulator